MKNSVNILFMVAMAAMVVLSSCKKDEVIDPLVVSSIVAGGNKDLNGATSATGVTTASDIVITFSQDVDAATATTTNITLMRGTTAVMTTITVSGKSVTVNPNEDLNGGANYTLAISGLKSTDGGALTASSVSFKTTGIGFDSAPQAASQTVYLQFNNGIADLAGNATASFSKVAYTADRFGVLNGAADFRGAATAGTGDIVELSGTGFMNASTTVSVWYKASSGGVMFGTATERGYFLELAGDMAWMKFATSHAISPDPNSHYFGTAWTDPNGDGTVGGQTLFDYTGSIADMTLGKWSHLVMTHDASTSVKTIYINGAKIMQVDLNLDATEWNLASLAYADKADGTGTAVAGIDQKLALGFFCTRANTATGWSDYTTATNTYKGAMDDFRIFSKALTESEVTVLYNAEKN